MYSPYQGYYQQQQTPPPAYAQYHQPFAPQLAPQPEYPQQYAHHHQQQGLHQHAQNHHFAPPQPHQYLQDSSCSSSQTAPQAHPPVISSPDIRGAQGVPLHICVASASGGSCVKCLNAAPRNEAVASRRTHRQIPHATLNVAVASGPRAFPRVPRELQSVLGAFDWTIQLGGGGGGDGEAWLMDGGSVLAKIGPMVNRSVRITKPVDVGRGYNAGMVMTRVDLPGPGYVVDWILQAAPGDQDIGFWAWYRYFNGAIRVWNCK
ncbi:hypothetical protein C8R44DRAFT_846239 [Mycena epipterygia]|nr:hypothetical protein C8R44DRAFT_846239 [Mycena epipterygia]